MTDPTILATLAAAGLIFSVGCSIAALSKSSRRKQQRPSAIQAEPKPLDNAMYGRMFGTYGTDVAVADCKNLAIDFFRSRAYRFIPGAPQILKQIEWQVLHDSSALTVPCVVTYKEGNQPFQITMRLAFFQNPSHSATHQSGITYDWNVGPPDARSELAPNIVLYTVDELVRYLKLHNPRDGTNGGTLLSSLGRRTASTPVNRQFASAKVADLPTERPFWPTPQDYNEAVQNPALSFDVAELRGGTTEVNALGLPVARSGAFASVYRLHTNERDYALKCFLSEVSDQVYRYRAISDYLQTHELPFAVMFEFLPDGIKIRTKLFPLLCMEWVEGTPLNFFVEQSLNAPEKLQTLLQQITQVAAILHENGIAHGDLQHGNILISNGAVKLVDYDGMFIPGMEGMPSNELGHRNYQHPGRTSQHFGPYLDNFSVWLIALSLRVLIKQPSLWQQFDGGDECLLLRQTDLKDPANSHVFSTFAASSDDDIRAIGAKLEQLLRLAPEQVPLYQDADALLPIAVPDHASS